MKKIITSLLFLALVATSFAQSIEFANGKVKSWYAPNTGLYDCKISLKNIKGQEVTLKYRKLSQVLPDSWSFTLCDNFNCLPYLPDTGTFYPMQDKEYAELKITIDSKGYADTAYIKYTMWDIETPGTIDTLDYSIYVKFNAYTNTLIKSTVTIYPNPANSFVTISANSGSKASIYSSNGQLILSKTLLVENENIDISNIKPGLYLVTVLNQEGIHSKQLIIE